MVNLESSFVSLACNSFISKLFLLQFLFVKAIVGYLNEVKLELSKVVWPKRQEVIRLTLVVIIISTAVGAYVGGLDFAFTKILELVLVK
jgi:preprotein translocase subunit SecE